MDLSKNPTYYRVRTLRAATNNLARTQDAKPSALVLKASRLRCFRSANRQVCVEAVPHPTGGAEDVKLRIWNATALEGIMSVTAAGIICQASPGLLLLFGYAEEELVGMPASVLVPQKVRGAGFTLSRLPHRQAHLSTSSSLAAAAASTAATLSTAERRPSRFARRWPKASLARTSGFPLKQSRRSSRASLRGSIGTDQSWA